MRQIRWIGAAAMLLSVVLPASPSRAQDSGGGSGLPTDGAPLCGVAQAPPPTAVSAVSVEVILGDTVPIVDDELRVATFNLLHSLTPEADESLGARLPLLAGAIVDSGADIVGAQEVTRNVELDPLAESPQKHGLVAERLAETVAGLTGEDWHWCWSLSNPHVPLSPDVGPGGGNPLDTAAAANGNFPDSGDFSEGLAIFSRYPIVEQRFRRLPPRSFEAPACTNLDPFCRLDALFDSRQVLWGRVATPGGDVDMFTTHLAHTLTELSDTTRLLQVQQALAITSEWATAGTTPDFLVGDFNSTPDSAVLAATSEAGFVDTYEAASGPECDTAVGDPGCSAGPTEGEEVYTPTATRKMSERIDYVLARPPSGCTLEVTASEAIGDVPAQLNPTTWLWPSDHLGFVSTPQCEPAEGGTSENLFATNAGGSASVAALDVARAGVATLPSTGGQAPLALAAALATGGVATAALRRRARPH